MPNAMFGMRRGCRRSSTRPNVPTKDFRARKIYVSAPLQCICKIVAGYYLYACNRNCNQHMGLLQRLKRHDCVLPNLLVCWAGLPRSPIATLVAWHSCGTYHIKLCYNCHIIDINITWQKVRSHPEQLYSCVLSWELTCLATTMVSTVRQSCFCQYYEANRSK